MPVNIVYMLSFLGVLDNDNPNSLCLVKNH